MFKKLKMVVPTLVILLGVALFFSYELFEKNRAVDLVFLFAAGLLAGVIISILAFSRKTSL